MSQEKTWKQNLKPVNKDQKPEEKSEKKEEKGELKKTEVKNVSSKHGVHTYSDVELNAFTQYINENLSQDKDLTGTVPLKVGEDLFTAVGEGILLNKLINVAKPGTVDERVINKLSEKKKKLNAYEIIENHNLSIQSAAGIGCSTVNIGNKDITEGNTTIILGLVWQIIKIGMLSDLSLKEHPELIVLLNEGETVQELLKKNPEELLRRWFNYQLKKAGSNRQVKGFGQDIADSECYTLVLNTITQGKCGKNPLNETDTTKRAAAMLQEADKAGLKKFVTPETIVTPNQKLNLLFVANMFNNYPNLDPVDKDKYADMLDFDEEGTREERSFRFWIQSMGIDCNNLVDDVQRDGLVLLKVEDKVQPNLVEWKKVNNSIVEGSKASYQILENEQKVVKYAKDMNLSVVNLSGDDLAKGNKKMILALTWQLMRKNLINVLKSLGEDGKEISENDIITWANEKVKHKGLKIDSFKDKSIGTGVFLCALCAAIKESAVNPDFITLGESKEDAQKNAKYAISVARKLNAPVFLLWEDVVEVKPKMITTFVGSLMYVDAQINGKRPQKIPSTLSSEIKKVKEEKK